jgi:hypothetical protein
MTRLRRATRAVDVAHPEYDGPGDHPDAYVGEPGVTADHLDDVPGDLDGFPRRGGHEQHGVTEGLDDAAPVQRDDVVAAALEDLDQVADLVLAEPVGQRAEADQVGEPDRGLGDLLILPAVPALDAGDGRDQVPPPRVGEQ